MVNDCHIFSILILYFACFGPTRIVNATTAKSPDSKRMPQKISGVYIPFATLGKAIKHNEGKLGLRIVTEADVNKYMKTIDTLDTETRYDVIENNNDALNMLGISGELSLALQFGAGSLSGSGLGSYMKQTTDRQNFVELLFVIKTRNRYEALTQIEYLISAQKCKDARRENYTHIITGIEYGSSCLMSCRARISNQADREEITGKIKAKLAVSKVDIEASGKLKKNKKSAKGYENLSISTFCNANLEKVATNFTEALKTIDDALLKIFDQNEAGVPVSLELTPLELIPSCQAQVAQDNPVYFEIFMDSISAMLDDIKTSRMAFYRCINVYSINKGLFRGLSNKIKEADQKMKNAIFNIKTNVLTLRKDADLSVFETFEYMYTATDTASVKIKSWNYRYWAFKVSELCREMAMASVIPTVMDNPTISKKMEYEICQSSNENNLEMTIGSSASREESKPKYALDASPTTCYSMDGLDGYGKNFWASRIKYGTLPMKLEIQSTAPDTLKGAEYYMVDDPQLFDPETLQFRLDELKGCHGTIPEPVADRPIKFIVNQKTCMGPYSVLVIVKTGKLSLCDVKLEGLHCKYVKQ